MSFCGSQTSSRPPPKPKVLQTRRLERAVAGEDHEVGPRDLLAVLLLDRPEQAAGLVEVGVVGPAVERREALRAVGRAAAAVGHAVGAGAVPRHADEERAVVAPVGRPPVLRGRHDLVDVLLHGRRGRASRTRRRSRSLAQRIALERVLVEDLEVRAGSATSPGWTWPCRSSVPWAPPWGSGSSAATGSAVSNTARLINGAMTKFLQIMSVLFLSGRRLLSGRTRQRRPPRLVGLHCLYQFEC